MRPIQLTVKGLNSFIEEQTIDFRKLTDKGLFGIFGPTGSGKSTILDGITLALYGQIARKSSNLMNMNCNDLAVTFQFQISGIPNRIYKVTRQFKRDKKTSKIRNHYAVIKEMTYDEPDILSEGSKGVTAECERILGLSLDDFTRTVVLPQGRFSEFLKLEGKERRKMLERLFNLQAYGDALTDKLKLKIKHDEELLNQFQGEMKSYQEVSSETLEQERKQLFNLTAQLSDFKRKQEDITEKYRNGERIWQLQNNLKVYQNRQNVLQSQEKEIEQKKEIVQRSQSIGRIRPTLEAFDEVKQALEYEGIKKEDLLSRQNKLTLEKETLETQFEQIRLEKEETFVPLSQAKEHIKEVILLKQEEQVIEKECLVIEQNLKTVDEKITYFETEYQKVENALNESSNALKLKQKEEDTLKIDSAIRYSVSEGIQLTKELLFYQKQLEELQEEYRKEEETYQKKQEETQKLRQEESLKDAINQLRHTLEEGKPCPVCGSLHHFEVAYQKQKEKQQKNMTILREKIKPLQEHLETLKATLKVKDLEGLNHTILQKDKRYEVLRKEIGQVTETVETLRQKKETLLEKKNSWYMSRERGESKRESAIKEQQIKKQKVTERWNLILTTLPKSYFEGVSSEQQLSLLQEQIEQKIEQIERDYQTLYKERENSQKAYDQVMIQLTTVQTTEKMHQKDLILKETWLNQLLQEEQLTLQEVRDFTFSKEMIQKMQEVISQYQEQVIELKGSIEAILKQLNHEHIEESVWQQLQQEYLKGQKEIEQKTIEMTKCQTLVDQMETALKRLEQLQGQKEAVEHRLAIWKDLESLFKGKKFVEFVATNRLQYISLEASKKLMEMTNGIYSLEADENGKFMICDYKNGGAKRDASTLSGGETFLVSLALALSLSAEIQLKGTAPLELFFLDEGFGTLDDTLLDIVMNSLETLHHDKLKVGIISHIDSIKERVPVKLVLTPAIAGEGGTKVKIEQ